MVLEAEGEHMQGWPRATLFSPSAPRVMRAHVCGTAATAIFFASNGSNV